MPVKTVILAAVVLGVCAPVAFGQTALPLEQAVKDGKAEAAITGMGGSTGDTILIIARRKVPESLRLTLTPGTVFKSVSGTVQNMVGASVKGERVGGNSYRPTAEIVLTDNDKHSYVVEAYCLDFHKANPGPRDSFTLAVPDPRAARILSAGQDKSASIGAIQAALWMSRDGLSPAQVQARFPVTAQDIAVARSVIAEVAQGANQQLKRQPEAVTASDAKPTIQRGDTVVVANEGAKLMAGDTVIALLKSGSEVKVAKVSGKWIAVVAVVNGASKTGWVNSSDLKRHPTQGLPKARTVSPPTGAASDTKISPASPSSPKPDASQVPGRFPGGTTITTREGTTYKGTKVDSYQTEVGELKHRCGVIIEKLVFTEKKNEMAVVGYDVFDSSSGLPLNNGLAVTPQKHLPPKDRKLEITLVPEIGTNRWIATNGVLAVDGNDDGVKLCEGHVVRIVGGRDHPVRICSQEFSDTTIVIRNGQPVAK